MTILHIILLLVCFVVLARVVDLFFIESLDKISGDLKLSSDAAGATLMAIGSSAPELFVALFAVLKPGNHEAIGIGSIVGSAIFNLLVIVGAASYVKQAKLTWQPMVRDLAFYILTVALLVWFISDGSFNVTESFIFLGMYILYVIAVIYWKKWFPYNDMLHETQIANKHEESNNYTKYIDRFLSLFFPSKKYYYLIFVISVAIIAALSFVLVESAVVIAHNLNIPESIIALTVLAAGTSVPDLFSSIIVARQGRGDMAVSNAVGSNIFDILVGLGLPFIIAMFIYGGEIQAGGDLTFSSIVLFGSAILLIILLLVRKWKVGKTVGIILLSLYLFYIAIEIFRIYG
ncbi:MAG: calcium/sodium antiporter [Prolixibacteraceae bacterium]|nr:calcium/sodium antiporter [Prolixibacteraceae bacterium]